MKKFFVLLGSLLFSFACSNQVERSFVNDLKSDIKTDNSIVKSKTGAIRLSLNLKPELLKKQNSFSVKSESGTDEIELLSSASIKILDKNKQVIIEENPSIESLPNYTIDIKDLIPNEYTVVFTADIDTNGKISQKTQEQSLIVEEFKTTSVNFSVYLQDSVIQISSSGEASIAIDIVKVAPKIIHITPSPTITRKPR